MLSKAGSPIHQNCAFEHFQTEVEKAGAEGASSEEPKLHLQSWVFSIARSHWGCGVILGCFLDPHFQFNLQHTVHVPPPPRGTCCPWSGAAQGESAL